jgi:hypothetical protein
MPLVEKPLVLSAAWGGERQNSSVGFDVGFSEAARCIGTRSYLEPNRDSLQKPIGGLSVMALFTINNRPEVEPLIPPLYKGGIDCSEHNSSPTGKGKNRAKTNIFHFAFYSLENFE